MQHLTKPIEQAIFWLERVEKEVPKVSPIINELAKIQNESTKDENQLDFLTQDLPVVSSACSN